MAFDKFKLAMELPDEIGIVASEAVRTTEDVESAVAQVWVEVNGERYNAVRVRGEDGPRVYAEWKPGHVVLMVERPAGWGVVASIKLDDKTFESLVESLKKIAEDHGE